MNDFYVVYNKKFEGCGGDYILYISDCPSRSDPRYRVHSSKIPNPHNYGVDIYGRLLVGVLLDGKHKDELEIKIGKGRLFLLPSPPLDPECAQAGIFIASDKEGKEICDHFRQYARNDNSWPPVSVIAAAINRPPELGFWNEKPFCVREKSTLDKWKNRICQIM